MERRKFLLTSGTVLFGSTAIQSVSQEPAVALEFEISGVDNADPSSTNTVLIDFKTIELTSHYIDESEKVTVKFTLNIEDHTPVQSETTVSLTNGEKKTKNDFGNAVPVIHDSISTDKSFLDGEITIDIDHPDISDTYQQSFVISSEEIELFESDLLAWWKLDDSNASDSSGNGYNGTINGPTTGLAGRGGLRSYRFDGSNDYVSVGSIPIQFDGSEDFTITGWFKTSTQADGTILSLSDDGSSNFRINKNSSGDWVLSFERNGNNINADTDVTDDVWHHAAVSYSSSDGWSFYVDGQPDRTGSASTWGYGSTEIKIGSRRDAGSSDPFNGHLCDIRVYKGQLSSSKIQTIYEQGSVDEVNPPDLNNGGVSYWKLNGDANDEWGSNNGSITGTSLEDPAIRKTGLSFNGSSDYIDTNAKLDIGTLGSLTYSAWIYDSGNGQEFCILANYDSSINDGTLFRVDRSRSKPVQLWFGNNLHGLADQWPTNEWIHVAVTYNGSKIKYYENGRMVNSISDSVSTSSSSTTKIGQRGDDRFYADGAMDEIRVYDRALLSDEIYQIYRYGTFGKDLRNINLN